jgi:hypothetical protein
VALSITTKSQAFATRLGALPCKTTPSTGDPRGKADKMYDVGNRSGRTLNIKSRKGAR